MKLPYGVTGGYYCPMEEKEAPLLNKHAFYKTCREISQKINITCKAMIKIGPYINYYAVRFNYSRPIYAVINASHPFITFCTNDDEETEFGSSYPLEFIDHDELTKEFSLYYTVVQVRELNKPFNLQEHEELKDVRSIIEQVEYWGPETIGDVLYNYWD